jgi:hypothetical protein
MAAQRGRGGKKPEDKSRQDKQQPGMGDAQRGKSSGAQHGQHTPTAQKEEGDEEEE